MSLKILNKVGEIAPAQITADIHPRGGSRWAWGGGCAERGRAEERAAADGCGLPRSRGERRAGQLSVEGYARAHVLFFFKPKNNN